MALQIVKNPANLPQVLKSSPHHATVSTIPRSGLRKIFGRRNGSNIPHTVKIPARQRGFLYCGMLRRGV